MDPSTSQGTFADSLNHVLAQSPELAAQAAAHAHAGDFWYLVTIFVLAVFVGFYVVWSVTPALHSPLMAVTNAVSSVIIVGAILAAGPARFGAAPVCRGSARW